MYASCMQWFPNLSPVQHVRPVVFAAACNCVKTNFPLTRNHKFHHYIWSHWYMAFFWVDIHKCIYCSMFLSGRSVTDTFIRNQMKIIIFNISNQLMLSFIITFFAQLSITSFLHTHLHFFSLYCWVTMQSFSRMVHRNSHCSCDSSPAYGFWKKIHLLFVHVGLNFKHNDEERTSSLIFLLA